ncbi:uncharacterized protein BJ212DRAFT_1305755 [Suillus subaureus]|uniref:C2H2-type domain-containing protein n=1 Tax=Suillus subaureus TaxID=48587 RepID=A0A9P7IZP4_9AGAM|nr:uncharacterized protein BJ212DRAFT_1305755 [Suillus subaureus]KAG1798352.1 hypothetical protein BJ212DRAFT_1305755 [Suillus subaureus]
MWQRASCWSLALVLFIFLLFNAFQVPCGHAGCKWYFKTTTGCTKHILSANPIMSFPPPEDYNNGLADVEPGIFQDAPDDANFSDYLDPAAEEPRSSPLPDVHTEFFGPRDSLNQNHHALLDGGVKWQGFLYPYSDEKPDGNYPPWMDGSYDVWY